MKNNRLFDWKIGACAAVIMLSGACVELDIVNKNDPDRERALTSAGDVEALIRGGFQKWWQTAHHSYPACALSVAADAHSSSWGNWGMQDASWEPRKAYDNSPSYDYRWQNMSPWTFSYQALAAVRDGLITIRNDTTGKFLEELQNDNDLERMIVFGKFIQAMSLANLAVLVDQAFIVDEEVDDVTKLEMAPYTEVWAKAEEKFAEVIQRAPSGEWTIPEAWVGFNGDWSSSRLTELARAYRARYRTQIPRTQDERDALDWNAILQDATTGVTGPFGGVYTQAGGTWVWHRSKLHCGGGYPSYAAWHRMDLRTIGPADASGKWEEWINAPPNEKRPFLIDTDDRRITGPNPRSDGAYVQYMGTCPFRIDRGLYHCSDYQDRRYAGIWNTAEFVDMTNMELEFIVAEANYRLGNRSAAMATVNTYRERGNLPAFTNPDGNAPGGNRCVPQMPDGSCGDLWEALKYEKRIEVYHYGFGTEYFDDRGWGDLVQWTWEQLPMPGEELLLLLLKIYTFGGPGGESSAADIASGSFRTGAAANVFQNLVNDFSPRALNIKRRMFEAWSAANTEKLHDVPVTH